jgi:DNA transformation protein
VEPHPDDYSARVRGSNILCGVAVSPDYLSYVLEQLAPAGRITSRRMFGAIGLYSDGAFFALIDDDTLYFKTGATNRADYEARGMRQFNPYPDRPERAGAKMGYHEVPADVLEDAEQLGAWARKSVAVAISAATKPRPRARRR